MRDIIKIHQTDKDFTKWYAISKEKLSKYIDEKDVERILHSSMFEILNDYVCNKELHGEIRNRCRNNIFPAIIERLGGKPIEEFSDLTSAPELEAYRLNIFDYTLPLGEYWIKLLDSYTNHIPTRLAVLDDLIYICSWTHAYTLAFAYQYSLNEFWDANFLEIVYYHRNYWEKKELERYCDTYPTLCEPSEYLYGTRYLYETREELLFDLINKGVGMRTALTAMQYVRKGKKLTEKYGDVIRRFDDDWMKEISKIRFLTSLSIWLQEVMDVNKLIE